MRRAAVTVSGRGGPQAQGMRVPESTRRCKEGTAGRVGWAEPKFVRSSRTAKGWGWMNGSGDSSARREGKQGLVRLREAVVRAALPLNLLNASDEPRAVGAWAVVTGGTERKDGGVAEALSAMMNDTRGEWMVWWRLCRRNSGRRDWRPRVGRRRFRRLWCSRCTRTGRRTVRATGWAHCTRTPRPRPRPRRSWGSTWTPSSRRAGPWACITRRARARAWRLCPGRRTTTSRASSCRPCSTSTARRRSSPSSRRSSARPTATPRSARCGVFGTRSLASPSQAGTCLI